jgi:hypothetical protein
MSVVGDHEVALQQNELFVAKVCRKVAANSFILRVKFAAKLPQHLRCGNVAAK